MYGRRTYCLRPGALVGTTNPTAKSLSSGPSGLMHETKISSAIAPPVASICEPRMTRPSVVSSTTPACRYSPSQPDAVVARETCGGMIAYET